MSVIDASAFTELAVGGSRAAGVREACSSGEWWVPEHFPIEVLSALRGLWLGRQLDQAAMITAAGRLADAQFSLVPTTIMISRILELASNVSAYDAAYVAAAELLDLPLVTLDRRLARADGPRCRFEVIE